MESPRSASFIHRVFYLLLHLVFEIYQFAVHLYQGVITRLHHVPAEAPSKLQRVPQHLTVLLGLEEPRLEDLSNLVVWCLGARINFVSFYDRKGMLKKQQDKLRDLINKKKSPHDHVIWHDGGSGGVKNGFSGNKVHVKVLSREDGQGAIVELTRQLATAASHNNKVFSIECVDENLRAKFEFPDPDLGVSCGENLCLYGYPPWQIRVTEFFTIKSHHDFTFDAFVKLLFRFNKCEQRWGK